MSDDKIMRCPECRSRKTSWLGWYVSRKAGRQHRRKCQSCGKVWLVKVVVSDVTEQVTDGGE